MNLRISDIGDIRIIGRANTIHKQLREIAAHHSFINQSEEATPTELSSPAGGECVPLSANFQDMFSDEPHYVSGLSKGVL